MNKPAFFFAATTAVFAMSTLYFAWQLNERDSAAVAEPALDAQGAPDAAVRMPAADSYTPPTPKPAADTSRSRGNALAAGGAPASARTAPASGADSRRGILAPFAADFLRQYDDLALRDALVDSARRGLESQYATLRDRLKLDPATFDQLVSLLTEEQLEQQANYFRCVVDAGCDLDRVPTLRDRSDELLALLGPDRHAQFSDYRDAMPEWQSVIQLRGRLSETQYLRDADAQRLQASLTEARKRFAADLKQQGAKLQGWGNGTGMLWYAGDGTVEQRLASATQYSQTLRRQASALLNAEQLRLFGQLQDEMLAAFGAYLQQAPSQGD